MTEAVRSILEDAEAFWIDLETCLMKEAGTAIVLKRARSLRDCLDLLCDTLADEARQKLTDRPSSGNLITDAGTTTP